MFAYPRTVNPNTKTGLLASTTAAPIATPSVEDAVAPPNGNGHPVNGRGSLRRKLKARSGGCPAVAQSSTRKRRVSDRKAWQLREKFRSGLGKARIAVELAHELGVDLSVWGTDESGNPRQLSLTFASCLSALTAQVEADLASLRND